MTKRQFYISDTRYVFEKLAPQRMAQKDPLKSRYHGWLLASETLTEGVARLTGLGPGDWEETPFTPVYAPGERERMREDARRRKESDEQFDRFDNALGAIAVIVLGGLLLWLINPPNSLLWFWGIAIAGGGIWFVYLTLIKVGGGRSIKYVEEGYQLPKRQFYISEKLFVFEKLEPQRMAKEQPRKSRYHGWLLASETLAEGVTRLTGLGPGDWEETPFTPVYAPGERERMREEARQRKESAARSAERFNRFNNALGAIAAIVLVGLLVWLLYSPNSLLGFWGTVIVGGGIWFAYSILFVVAFLIAKLLR